MQRKKEGKGGRKERREGEKKVKEGGKEGGKRKDLLWFPCKSIGEAD